MGLIGQTISHYKIVEKLGEGGMGVVYKATDTTLNRDVAIKLLPPQLKSDTQARKRFIHEARAASALNHANIAVVHEIGETPEGQVFIVMACYEGQTLKDKLADGALPLDEAIKIVCQVASGLAAAHEKGILHRDVKPANILFGSDGHAKLADFGLAKLAGQTRMTKTGTTVGTVAYMSPEQARGDDVDHRSDIHSLAVVLYELVTGRVPFEGDNDMAILYQVANADPAPASTYRSDLPPGIDTILTKALAKDPDDRYASADEFLKDLDALQGGRAITGVRLRRRRSSGWVVAASVVAGVAVTIVVYGAVSKFLMRGAETDTNTPSVARSSVAVMPFTVRGETDVAGLGEGMVDLLSSRLDGAGSLRSVDPRAMLTFIRQQGWQSGDLARSREIAKHFGAGLFILGNVFQSTDRVNISAALYESNGAADPVATASVDGEESLILTLVDDLTTQLLKEQLERDGTAAVELGSLTTRSYPALKAYLEGESAFRAAAHHADRENQERAARAYQKAVAEDSTFALAWYRLAEIADRAMVTDVDAGLAVDRALEHSEGLSEHDQLHFRALRAKFDDNIDEAEQTYQTILGLAPECLDATVSLSHLRHYEGWRQGEPISDGRAILERAVTLDPENRDCLFRLGWMDAFDGDWAGCEEAYRRMYGDDMPVELATMVAFGSGAREDEAAVFEKLKSAPDFRKLSAVFHVAVFTDDLDGARELSSVLIEGERSDESKTLGRLILAHIEIASGRWNAAKQELATVASFNPALAIEYKALFAAHPFLDVAASERQAILDELRAWDASDVPMSTSRLPWISSHDGFHPVFKTYLTGLLEISLGNYEVGSTLASELEQTRCAPADTTLGPDLAQALRGMSAMRQGQSEKALEELAEAKYQVSFGKQIGSLIHFRSLQRYLRAELLSETGRSEEAVSWFSSFAWSASFEYIYKAPALLRRAQICERLDQTEQAAEYYARFIGLWQNCDPPLRPAVDEARARLLALDGKNEG
jgi:tetratricopeptide (TPR) repeat protein